MTHYNFKQMRDALPPEMVDKWMEEDGSADYNSSLWRLGAERIKELEAQLIEARELADQLRHIARHILEEDWTFPWESQKNIVGEASTETKSISTNCSTCRRMTREQYDNLKASGKMFEFFPDWKGRYENDILGEKSHPLDQELIEEVRVRNGIF